jgi:hypothetical protein
MGMLAETTSLTKQMQDILKLEKQEAVVKIDEAEKKKRNFKPPKLNCRNGRRLLHSTPVLSYTRYAAFLLHSFLPSFLHSFIPSFLHSFIPSFPLSELLAVVPSFHHSIVSDHKANRSSLRLTAAYFGSLYSPSFIPSTRLSQHPLVLATQVLNKSTSTSPPITNRHPLILL